MARAARERLVLVTVLLGALAVSVAFGVVQSVPDAEDAVAGGSHLTAAEPRHAPIARVGLNARAFDALAAALRHRFYVDVPEGSRGIFVTRAAVVRAIGSFYLLPAIRVTDRRRADVVLSYRFDGTYSLRRLR